MKPLLRWCLGITTFCWVYIEFICSDESATDVDQ